MPKSSINITEVAALIYFDKHVTKERVEKWVAKLKEQGHATSAVVGEYDTNIGAPVWYIP